MDTRRQTTNEETLALNVARLKAYKTRLLLFPRKSGQHKKLDSSDSDIKMADDESKVTRAVGAVLPIETGTGIKHGLKEIKKGDMPKG